MFETVSLTKNFGGLKALESITMEVNEGEIIGIIGPNGAGKTTLFNLITGLYQPSSGRIIFNGNDITTLNAYQIATCGIGRTFQNIRLLNNLSVLENVLVGRHIQSGYGVFGAIVLNKKVRQIEEENLEKCRYLLELVGLDRYSWHKSGSLSYGNQRKLEIARALAVEPLVVLLDEPTAGMNAEEAEETKELIKKIRTMGKTLLIIEHNMNVVMDISDRVVVIDHGVKIAEGRPEQVQNNPLVIEAYLGKEL